MVLVVGEGLSVYTAVHVVPVDPSVGARSGAGKTIPPFRFEDHVLLEFRANKNPRCYAFQHPLSRHPTWMLSIAPAPITIPKPLLACRCESEDKSKKEDIKRIVRGEGSFQKTTRNDLKLSDPRTKNSSICQRILAPFIALPGL